MPTVKKAPAKKTVTKKADGLTDRQRRVYEYLKKQTADGFGKHLPKPEAPKPEKKASEKATKLSKLIPNFGGYGPHLAQVMEVILGEKIPGVAGADPSRTDGKEIPKNAFIAGACIVPVGNSNGHDYPIGKVAMVLHYDYYARMMRNGGGTGNNITQHSRELRLPTDAELRAFAIANCERIITKLRLVLV